MVLTLLRVDGLHGNFGWTINILFNFLSIRKIIDYRKATTFLVAKHQISLKLHQHYVLSQAQNCRDV